MDPISMHSKTQDRLLRELYQDEVTLEKQNRMNLFRVNSDDEWQVALKDTQQQNRVPLMIRTPRCHFMKEQAIEKLINVFGFS